MKRVLWRVLLGLGLAVCMWTSAAADAPQRGQRVSGSIVDGSERWTARDVWAYGDAHRLRVVISSVPLDARTLLADGRVDDADLDRVRAQGVALMRLDFNADASYCIGLLLSNAQGHYSRSVPGSEVEAGLRLKVANGRMRATLLLPDIELRFDTLVLSGETALGKHLPADAGEFGAPLQSLLDAIADPASTTWLERLHPDLQQRWQQGFIAQGLDPATIVTAARPLFPKRLQQLRGVRDGERFVQLQASDTEDRHWTVQFQPHQRQWQVSELALQMPLPDSRDLPSVQSGLYQHANDWYTDGIHLALMLWGGIFLVIFIIMVVSLIRLRIHVRKSISLRTPG